MERRLQIRRDIHHTNRKTVISSKKKGQDNSGLGRWTFTTILEKNNNKTTISNVYRLGNTVVELVGNSTVMKQQWILLKQSSTKGHPHGVIINV